jgi:hypothetical protein
MREETIKIDELNKGLAKRKPLLNEMVYTSCKNFIFESKRLEKFTPFDIKGSTISSIFPQIIKGKKFDFYLTETNIQILNSDNSLTNLTFLDKDLDSISIPSGNSWKLLDFGNKWFLFNGSCMVENIADSEKAIVYTDVYASVGEFYKGRGVLAGFSEITVSSGWQLLINTLNKRLKEAIFSRTDKELVDHNFIFWSGIGQNLITALFPNNYNEDLYTRMIEENSFGYMPMEWSGEVLNLIEFNELLYVFGTNGISVVNQADITLGQKTLRLDIGLKSRDSIAKTDNEILFIGTDNRLHYINKDNQFQKLYYDKIIDLTESYKVFSEGEYIYLTNSSTTYVFHEGELTEIGQKIISFRKGEIYGTTLDSNQSVKLSETNFGFNCKKQISFIDFGIDYDTDLQARLIVDGYEGNWITANGSDNLYFGMTGDKFVLEIKGNISALSYIIFRLKVLDHNQIRGRYVS